MPRELSTEVKQELFSPRTGEFHVELLTITHNKIGLDIRVVNDIVDYVYNSETYLGCPFSIELLSDNEQPPVANLRVRNEDKRIGLALQDIHVPLRLNFKILYSLDFDLTVKPRAEIGTASVIYEAAFLTLRGVKVDASQVQGRLTTFDYSSEPFPSLRVTKDKFPGIYR